MTLAIPRATRRSRFLFDFSPSWALRASDQALDAITGQAATFTRASVKYAIDAAGRYQCVPYGRPAFEWVDLNNDGIRETPGVLLEGARTNLVVQSDALATGWTTTAGSVANAIGTYAGRPFSRRVGGGGQCFKSVTLTGNGVKALSLLVKYDGSAGTSYHGLLDNTALTWRGGWSCTWAADGTMTASPLDGATILATESLADGVYRVLIQTTACVAANNNVVFADRGNWTVTSVLISGVQVEDAPFPSSLIPTTTTTVTTVADALSYTLNVTPAQIDVWRGLTVYWKVARPAYAGSASQSVPFWSLGATPEGIQGWYNSGGLQLAATIRGAADAHAVAAIPAGAFEASAQFTGLTTGAATVAIDAGAGLSAPVTTAGFSAFASQTLAINAGAFTTDPGGNGSSVFTGLRIAAGVQTLDYMRVG